MATVAPGAQLELDVEIESCDDDAVAYSGFAHVDGAQVIELRHCLGPMLPVQEFDAPEALRERLGLLCAAGAPGGRFRGVAMPSSCSNSTEWPANRRGPAAGTAVRAVLRRSLSAAPRISRHVAPGQPDPAGDGSCADGDRRSGHDIARAAAHDPRQDALVHCARAGGGTRGGARRRRRRRGAHRAPFGDPRRARGGNRTPRHRRRRTLDGNPAPRRDHRTGSGHAGRQRCAGNLGRRYSPAAVVAPPISLFDASGFRFASPRRSRDSMQPRCSTTASCSSSPTARTALRSPPRSRHLSTPGFGPRAATAERWGCAVGTGMMGVDFSELVAVHGHSAASGELDAAQLLSDASANNPLVFCRSQSTTGLSLLTRRHGIRGYATLRPHRLRLRRAGDRHRAQAHPPRGG